MRVLALSFLVLGGISSSCLSYASNDDLSGEEIKFYNIVNQFRQMLNVPALTINDSMQAAARKHSAWMVGQDDYQSQFRNPLNVLSHFGPTPKMGPADRLKAEGYALYSAAGENISCGNGDAVKTFQQFAYSPGHLQNLVNIHYREAGMAREGTGRETCPYYWTNDFGSQIPIKNDGSDITDIEVIKNAIIAVSGPVPVGKTVALPPSSSDSRANAGSSAGSGSSSGGAPTQVNNGTSGANSYQTAFNDLNIGGMSMSSQIASVNTLQCLVPYAMGRKLVTQYINADTLLQAKKSSSNTYSVTMSYFASGILSTAAPVITDTVTITQNPDFPIVTLFVAPGSILGGFIIQVNMNNGHGQFDSYGMSPGVTGTINCTVN